MKNVDDYAKKGYNNIYILSLLVSALILIISCKKDTVYTDYPYNDIEQFVITDAVGNSIKAVIKNDSIIVYWPPLQDVPEYITPTIITVSDRAAVSPASGEAVAFSKETTYTVTAQDGSIRTYTLYPNINQPEPTVGIQVGNFFLGSSIGITALNIQGEYLIPDTNSTKVFLIDTVTLKEIPIPMEYLSSFSYNYIQFKIPYESGIVPGGYDVKVTTGIWSKIAGRYSLNPGRTAPDLVSSYTFNQNGQQVAQGSDITVSYSISGPSAVYFRGNYTHVRIRSIYNVNAGEAQIVNQTDDVLTFRLPDDIAVGTQIGYIDFYNSALSYEQPSGTSQLQLGSVSVSATVISK